MCERLGLLAGEGKVVATGGGCRSGDLKIRWDKSLGAGLLDGQEAHPCVCVCVCE